MNWTLLVPPAAALFLALLLTSAPVSAPAEDGSGEEDTDKGSENDEDGDALSVLSTAAEAPAAAEA